MKLIILTYANRFACSRRPQRHPRVLVQQRRIASALVEARMLQKNFDIWGRGMSYNNSFAAMERLTDRRKL